MSEIQTEMEFYDGPVDVYDADGNMLSSNVPALLELDDEGRWWGRLRSAEAVPQLPRSGMIALSNGKVGHVRFTGGLGANVGGSDMTDVDFEGTGEAPFGPAEQGRD